jgi:hypothetical protein
MLCDADHRQVGHKLSIARNFPSSSDFHPPSPNGTQPASILFGPGRSRAAPDYQDRLEIVALKLNQTECTLS